ncbi:MAG: hypothetical protein JHD15_08570 [Phenylobacterium sp.]|uniref:hypothetical protein n=1 Tax=Phenylobacterium sp. TaxID=1871053 RepID=UPI001A251C6A|nr:hypothetical protein [Phenylobacterium sp.]MBJ7410403.1 hypothetical protein [Phenylobacterium sp.]
MWIRRQTAPLERGCGGSFSFYRHLIAPFWAGGADETAAAPLHRLCTLARKMHVRSIVIEDALERPDVAAEIEHLEAWAPVKTGEVTAAAVSFLTRPRGRAGPPAAEDLIGQAVIITFPVDGGQRSYVHEAVFRLPRSGRRAPQPLLNNYVPVVTAATVEIRGARHDIEAAVFHQQNGVTSVCVHSTVRCLLRNLAHRTVSTAELNAVWAFAGGRHEVNTVKLKAAFEHYGVRPVPYDLTDKNAPIGHSVEDTTWRTLTCLAESGTSGVLIFEPVGPASHVVPVLGFTLNTDEWLPQAAPAYLEGRPQEETSSAWVDHLVVHDDLLGPYYCISRSGLFERPTGRRATLKPNAALALLPPAVEVSPVQAEEVAREAFAKIHPALRRHGFGTGVWWDLLTRDRARRVYRTTLVRRDDYIAGLRSAPFRRNAKADALETLADLESKIPEQFWLVELTLPQLFVGNRAKLGELLIEVAPADDLAAVAGFRLPGVIASRAAEPNAFMLSGFPLVRHSAMHAPIYHSNGW